MYLRLSISRRHAKNTLYRRQNLFLLQIDLFSFFYMRRSCTNEAIELGVVEYLNLLQASLCREETLIQNSLDFSPRCFHFVYLDSKSITNYYKAYVMVYFLFRNSYNSWYGNPRKSKNSHVIIAITCYIHLQKVIEN